MARAPRSTSSESSHVAPLSPPLAGGVSQRATPPASASVVARSAHTEPADTAPATDLLAPTLHGEHTHKEPERDSADAEHSTTDVDVDVDSVLAGLAGETTTTPKDESAGSQGTRAAGVQKDSDARTSSSSPPSSLVSGEGGDGRGSGRGAEDGIEAADGIEASRHQGIKVETVAGPAPTECPRLALLRIVNDGKAARDAANAAVIAARSAREDAIRAADAAVANAQRVFDAAFNRYQYFTEPQRTAAEAAVLAKYGTLTPSPEQIAAINPVNP